MVQLEQVHHVVQIIISACSTAVDRTPQYCLCGVTVGVQAGECVVLPPLDMIQINSGTNHQLVQTPEFKGHGPQ